MFDDEKVAIIGVALIGLILDFACIFNNLWGRMFSLLIS